MKAVLCSAYGSPDVLQLQQIETPQPLEHEVLIRVHATTVNSADIRIRKADPFAVRFVYGWKKPKYPVLGVSFSGVVVATGSKVVRFKEGDAVYGMSDQRFGAYAEYLCLDQHAAIAVIPHVLSFEEAAAIPFGATTALYFLTKAKIAAGSTVLINGASGAVGIAAVQLACSRGARVTAICSKANTAMVQQAGAHEVLNYDAHDLGAALLKGNLDVVMDTVNTLPLALIRKAVKPGGTVVLSAAGLSELMQAGIRSMFGSYRLIAGVAVATASEMNELSALITQAALKAFIDRTYPLEAVREAHQYVELGHKKGNVILVVYP